LKLLKNRDFCSRGPPQCFTASRRESAALPDFFRADPSIRDLAAAAVSAAFEQANVA
jgi:hypothetical protein